MFNNAIQGEISPNWDEVLQNEDSYDGNLMTELTFLQDGMLNKDVQINEYKIESTHYLSS